MKQILSLHTTTDSKSRFTYYSHFRKDVLAVIPPDAKRILSVGCAAGITEAELVKRGITIVGIEINSKAANIARQKGIIVLEGDAAEIDVDINGEPYDCLIYADVLEHLPDPLNVLKKHVRHLRTGGLVYACVPNFRHYSVFLQLFIRGHIRYRDAGLLDNTHLRITTKKMVTDWYKKANIDVLSSKYLIPRRREKIISFCSFRLLNEFIANQVGVIGKKRS